jgi:hypothetical protein
VNKAEIFAHKAKKLYSDMSKLGPSLQKQKTDQLKEALQLISLAIELNPRKIEVTFTNLTSKNNIC